MYTKPLTWKQRFLLWIRNYAYIEHRKYPDWRAEMPFYVARCPIHGLVETRTSGGRGRLLCPLCPIRSGQGGNIIARVW